MKLLVELGFECYHKPTQSWHTHTTERAIGAVSRKHAITKGLKIAERMPGHADRAGHPDWDCSVFARINE